MPQALVSRAGVAFEDSTTYLRKYETHLLIAVSFDRRVLEQRPPHL